MTRRRHRLVAACCLAITLGAAGWASVGAQGSTGGQIGLAHVDLLDLHVERRPDTPPKDIERLPAGEIAQRYALAVQSGARWHRWSLNWDLVDRGGTFFWDAPDGILGRDVQAGLQTLAVLHGLPLGATNVDGAPEGTGQPIFRRADGAPTDDPAEAAAVNPDNPWARFVAAVVNRYRPGGELAVARGWGNGIGIRAWEIGSEPNLRSFWRGSPADFVRFLEVGYLVVKWLDPAATVVHGGIADDGNAAWWYGLFADALKARAAASPLPARYNFYFDKAAWHWYQSPSKLDTGPARARALLTQRGLPAKPIWVTEMGVPVWSEHPGPCWDPNSPHRVSSAEQAAYIWQALADGLAAGVETMIYFQLYDDCGNGPSSYDALGLVRNTLTNQCWTAVPNQGCWHVDPALAGTPRPAYEAFQVAVRELAGARAIAGSSEADGAWRRVVLSRNDARIIVAWNESRADRTVALEATRGAATLHELDESGHVHTRSVTAGNGRYQVHLPGATNHNDDGGTPLVGGRPVMLVEGRSLAGVASAAAPAPAQNGANVAPVEPPAAPAKAGPPDTVPPVLAIVRQLPPLVPPRFDVAIIAGDEASGLDAFQLYYALGSPPTRSEDWQPYGEPRPWPGRPLVGQIGLSVEGRPGVTYFAARARDRAGNWTDLPSYPQAMTQVVGAAEAATAEPPPTAPTTTTTRPRSAPVGFHFR